RIEGHLGSQWTDWFDGFSVALEAQMEKRFFLDLCLINQPYAGCCGK
ncbi:MAG: hypothetical protein IPP55_09540, partial [Anaerolineales bacterium]|nr:hypothetical protein [Anaerolineales bacterium]